MSVTFTFVDGVIYKGLSARQILAAYHSALWGLNRARCRGLFVLFTPLVGDPLFKEPIVMALFLEV